LSQTVAHTIPRTFDQVKISHSRITAYREIYPDRISEEAKKKREANLTRGKYNGYMSQKTKIKVRDYLHNWMHSVDRFFSGRRQYKRKAGIKFVFITLTLPAYQNHTDQEIKHRALRPFLQQLQRIHRVRNYLWVAEPQKAGNIHFHIIVDREIDHRKLRKLWNGYMQDLGYIQDYRDGQLHFHRDGFQVRSELLEKWSYGAQVEAYMRGTKENWSNPNTTDIHKINHIKNLPAYMTKYITKSNGSRPIDGRLWGCSDTLRDIKAITIPLSYRLKQVLMTLAQEKGSCFFGTDFNWTLWRFSGDTLHQCFPVLNQIWSNFSRHCIRKLYPKLLDPEFFDSLAPPVIQMRLELQSVYAFN